MTTKDLIEEKTAHIIKLAKEQSAGYEMKIENTLTSIIDTTLQAVEDRIRDEGLSIHGACDCLAELEEILKDLRE